MKFKGKSQENCEDLKRHDFAKERPFDERRDRKVAGCFCHRFPFGIFNSCTDFNLACYRKQSSDGYPDSAKVEALPTQKLAGL